MKTAYLAAEGHERRLATELDRAGVAVRLTHGRLFVTDGPAVQVAWAANTWFDAEEVSISSIRDGADTLRSRQRSWAVYAPEHRGRAGLIVEKLPSVSGRALDLRELAPSSPLGSWTLLDPTTMLLPRRCSSSFANGEVQLAEIRHGPPNRAYRKLWEAFVVLGRYPSAGDGAVDLGASPGGWTWLLHELGCNVVAVDKAPLDPAVERLPRVEARTQSAFAPLEDDRVPRWVTSDIACYPERLFGLIDRWCGLNPKPTLIFTIKFQGETDHDIVDRFRSFDGARLVHLHHNKHELTLFLDP